MSEEQMTVILIKAAIDDLPAEEKRHAEVATEEMRRTLEAHGPAARLAVALIGAELAAGYHD